ncbi:MAG: MltA domain-containing protein, partial [Thalassobaculaceae bacterium]
MSVYFWFKTLLLISVFYCLGCAKIPDPRVIIGEIELKKIPVESLPGFGTDKIDQALFAFRKSCEKIARKNLDTLFGSQLYTGSVKDWVDICTGLPGLGSNNTKYRRYLRQNFKAYKIDDLGNPQGLFTGYFEPILKGSLTKSKKFSIPIYPRPLDLVLVSLGDWRKSMKGKRIAGKVVGPRLKPYFTRKEIREGALVSTTEPIIWLSSDIDAFFLHIQGSGKIELPDGSQVRIGYAGHNGHNYFPIGRHLKKIGAIRSEDMSLQKIKSWLI